MDSIYLGDMTKFLWTFVLLLCVTSALGSCPHDKFLHDHVCPTCLDNNTALEFSKNKWSPSVVNTVLVITQTPNYSLGFRNGEEICEAETKISIVWQCRSDRGYCNKREENQVCRVHHATRNGHFFYQWMTC